MIRSFIILFGLWAWIGYAPLSAQNNFDIRFQLESVDCDANTFCYHVQVRSSDATAWGLAGQNYRLYYDASLASFTSGVSLLPAAYQSFNLVQDIQDANASAVGGSLPFEGTLGFLNYSMDLNDVTGGGVTLPGDGTWVSTSEICFAAEADLFTNPSSCLEAVWARDGVTNGYAVAFVEISEWAGSNNTQAAVGSFYDDLDAADGDASCFDTSCATAAPDAEYDIQLVLDTIDCDNSTACYLVQLRSANGGGWGLAGQNYRLYYDGSLASWQSGVSVLPTADYQSFTLIQDIQGVDASGAGGSLAFDTELSFLNYTMDLTDFTNGGLSLPSDGSWLTTSELCFSLEPELLDDLATCLEAVWARDGLTNEYATSFVEVSEWEGAGMTAPAMGAGYNDLDPSDGEGSCFAGSCQSGDYEIRLVLDTVDCTGDSACYLVQLRSPDGNGWGLAGQNYRLYYDGSLASWLSDSSLLPDTSYQDFTLVQDIQDVDASGAGGSLAFDANLSFLNYTMDLTNVANGGLFMPSDTSWLTTSRLCFALEPELLNQPSTCLEAVWARDGLTNEYATSFVEVSEWEGPGMTAPATGVAYDDLDPSDGEGSCFVGSCPAGNYDVQLVLDTIDCPNRTACYLVQLRSPDGNGWGLAGQNYRLYYDGSLASWQSGTSTLPTADYQSFTLIQDVQGVDASPAGGSLAFDTTLSFLNYTMDLTDFTNGGISLPSDTSWLTTSRLCFSLEPELLDDPTKCLEAVWARTGLTDEYATSFVEVSEWAGPSVTVPAAGMDYNDLDPSDGEGSCFDGSCCPTEPVCVPMQVVKISGRGK